MSIRWASHIRQRPLAMRYGADVNNAILAGMLHDCAKCLTNEKKISICEKYNIAINAYEQANPFLYTQRSAASSP